MPISDNKSIYQKVGSVKEFYFSFFELFKHQLKIKRATDIHVLTYLCMNMEYNSNKSSLNTTKRSELCSQLNIKNPHLSASLKRLKEIDMIKGDKGEYELNPFLVWRGRLDEREKMLRTKGVEIRLLFKTTCPEEAYNPLIGGSQQWDA